MKCFPSCCDWQPFLSLLMGLHSHWLYFFFISKLPDVANFVGWGRGMELNRDREIIYLSALLSYVVSACSGCRSRQEGEGYQLQW
jgi:hypothetical protein